ncbi:hypothetical protein H9L12_06485 [Sphingomonas rhizophila]|uniref:Lipoprotein n=1 Tax=Sphingomonas rhizophila TaxID=2071607 RepID=A0A7G9S887_9SPHN|nr:hypothetical protein [Sphingomonas rhizophila]QNN64062.1 hypothetical protein H9L12_06485 [Sphingomonas rhizophila]
MPSLSLRSAAVAVVLGLSASACTSYGPYGGLGVGYGSGYGNYGYGSPYGYSNYGYSNYGRYPSYYGWNNGYYYPGTGYYVYDQYRRPYRWSSTQQRYWTDRQRAYSTTTNRPVARQNWSVFHDQAGKVIRERREQRRRN